MPVDAQSIRIAFDLIHNSLRTTIAYRGTGWSAKRLSMSPRAFDGNYEVQVFRHTWDPDENGRIDRSDDPDELTRQVLHVISDWDWENLYSVQSGWRMVQSFQNPLMSIKSLAIALEFRIPRTTPQPEPSKEQPMTQPITPLQVINARVSIRSLTVDNVIQLINEVLAEQESKKDFTHFRQIDGVAIGEHFGQIDPEKVSFTFRIPGTVSEDVGREVSAKFKEAGWDHVGFTYDSPAYTKVVARLAV